jgi:hypothetical protein
VLTAGGGNDSRECRPVIRYMDQGPQSERTYPTTAPRWKMARINRGRHPQSVQRGFQHYRTQKHRKNDYVWNRKRRSQHPKPLNEPVNRPRKQPKELHSTQQIGPPHQKHPPEDEGFSRTLPRQGLRGAVQEVRLRRAVFVDGGE